MQKAKSILIASLVINISLVIWMVSTNKNAYIQNLKIENKDLAKENKRLLIYADSIKTEKKVDKLKAEQLKSEIAIVNAERDSLQKLIIKRISKYSDVKNTRYTNISDSTLIRGLSRITFDPNSL